MLEDIWVSIAFLFRNNLKENDPIESDDMIKDKLKEYGIMRLPYSDKWLDYFINHQRWIFDKSEEILMDTKASSAIPDKTYTLDEVIPLVEDFVNKL